MAAKCDLILTYLSNHNNAQLIEFSKIKGLLAGVSFYGAFAGLNVLVRLGVIRELTDKRRYCLFGYRQYLDILGEGTEWE